MLIVKYLVIGLGYNSNHDIQLSGKIRILMDIEPWMLMVLLPWKCEEPCGEHVVGFSLTSCDQ